VKLLVGVGFASLVAVAAESWPMWSCAILLSCATGVASDVQAPLPVLLSDTVRAHLRHERFQVVSSVRGLPLGVREELQRMFGSSALAIAEPGAPFQVTDVITDPTLPLRRMHLAGCSQDHCLVYYERGGIAHTWYAVLFRWTPDHTRVDAGGAAPAGLRTVDELRNVVMSGALKGPGRYW
jgi:hypothetical protein